MWQEITYTLPGPGRVDAQFEGLTIATDHPPPAERGDRPPTPWCLFLASIGTCMASFVAGYCEELGLDATGLTLVQRQELAEDDTIPAFTVEIRTPEGFPEEHLAGLVAAAEECSVKRVIEAGPRFLVQVKQDHQALE